MIFISHRGNIDGRNPDLENKPEYIMRAVNFGFDCEIDVWKIKNNWLLGHDEPQYLIEKSFLLSESLWCHAKNKEALEEMLKEKIHCFWHEEDKYTLTSKGYIWTYPNVEPTEQSICMLLENKQKIKTNYAGICSDYIINYREKK